MFELVFIVIIAFFGIFGLSEALHILKMLFLKPKQQPKRYLICEVEGENAGRQILSVAENFRWYGSNIADYVVFLGDGFNDDLKEICSIVSKNEKIFFCDKTD